MSESGTARARARGTSWALRATGASLRPVGPAGASRASRAVGQGRDPIQKRGLTTRSPPRHSLPQSGGAGPAPPPSRASGAPPAPSRHDPRRSLLRELICAIRAAQTRRRGAEPRRPRPAQIPPRPRSSAAAAAATPRRPLCRGPRAGASGDPAAVARITGNLRRQLSACQGLAKPSLIDRVCSVGGGRVGRVAESPESRVAQNAESRRVASRSK